MGIDAVLFTDISAFRFDDFFDSIKDPAEIKQQFNKLINMIVLMQPQQAKLMAKIS
ncbi:uncharacterized protein PHACADRAFT_198675 [Phanerochaete carnosa HHB-10118-sp]|uniref:Uncharacterized protein n=1 Tax=Phanerochaete carnosa (strain HHB-10118-sp) TaxID=650164 RepID=K5W150_PHACS|nr:uncharacterized protein PHACADRAFT_198675 [Phanerochaete carnosa HHB-10118-sp]EKM52629.1 hypothetical protein PHACADRAFT_198675 [Phanerochaete carnosa HHB-10118-sp]